MHHKHKENSEKNFEDVFWADQLADKVINRKKYRYLDREIKNQKSLLSRQLLHYLEFFISED